MASRVYIFVPQLAADPPLNPMHRAFESPSEAIQEAKTLLAAIAQRAGLQGGTIEVGEQPAHEDVHWLGAWQWNDRGLWTWRQD
jgi:hypothetical protein